MKRKAAPTATTIGRDITDMVRALHAHIEPAGQAETRQMLSHWPPDRGGATPPEPSDLPVTRWLAEAADMAPAATADLVRHLAEVKSALRWQQSYSAADIGQRFLDRYGWTLLVGPNAPVESDSLLAGFLMLGPDLEYPVHQHSAEEIYVILSGTASWTIGEAGWAAVPPGRVIHNPPWQPHGMRTDQGEPLVMGFVWHASVAEKSKILGNRHTKETTT